MLCKKSQGSRNNRETKCWGGQAPEEPNRYDIMAWGTDKLPVASKANNIHYSWAASEDWLMTCVLHTV